MNAMKVMKVGRGNEDQSSLMWPGAARAMARNATMLKAIALVSFVCLAIVFSTAGIYLRSWQLQFQMGQLKDLVLISNEPDDACKSDQDGKWEYGPIENFKGCDARQREDFTRSYKELYDQCISTHPYSQDKQCTRGKEVQVFVFNVTNPQDVVEGLTPRIEEIGRKSDGGPLIFYEDCKTFDTEFGAQEVQFSQYCYYTYKYPSTERDDLTQEIVTVNVGLMEAIGNSINLIDYIVPVVWGTHALEYLNVTTTNAEDYIRGQTLSFSWPNGFGDNFLSQFSPAQDRAGFQARDNARKLFEMVLDKQLNSCLINGTTYDRAQCTSMANTLGIYARRFYESFQTYNVPPFGLRFQQGAGLFVRVSIGQILGYYAGHDDPFSAYLFPKKVSWNAIHSQTQVEVEATINAGVADATNGILNPGPLGRSSLVTNALRTLGDYTRYAGREFVTEFDFPGCRPLSKTGEVVVPADGPYPPQCNGGTPLRITGTRGSQVKPRIWSTQPGIDQESGIRMFIDTLMRPVVFSAIGDIELEADGSNRLWTKGFELKFSGLKDAAIAFNCDPIFKTMAEAGVLNRGTDCDLLPGMFDLRSVNNFVPYVWSLPDYYLVVANDSTQHPRNNIIGMVTPTGDRYRSMVVVEPESGFFVQSMLKEQISIKLYTDEKNYFFSKHKPVIIPLYWKSSTVNATISQRALLYEFQNTFRGLNAGFIVCVVLGGVSLIAALFFGMLLYRQSSFHTIEEKRKRIQAELASSLPPQEEQRMVDEDEEQAAGYS